MDIVGTLINLVSGGIGGNISGASWKEMSLGTVGNTIAGALGGVAGTYILQAMGVLNTLGLSEMTLGSIASGAGGAAVSGAVVTGILGLIKNKLMK